MRFVDFRKKEDLKKEYENFNKLIHKIYNTFQNNIPDPEKLNFIIHQKKELKSDFLKTKSKPEEFTKRSIIEPLFSFLGLKANESLFFETHLKKLYGRNFPDYKTVYADDLNFLVEAKPINFNPYDEGSRDAPRGVGQVKLWLQHKASRTNYGIFTDGFKWILIKYDDKINKYNILCDIDISIFFKKILNGQEALQDLYDIFYEFYSYFSKKYSKKNIINKELILEEIKEKITRKFFEDYSLHIYGALYDQKGKIKKKENFCLINRINNVKNEEDLKEISQTIMDRLIFIKFLEYRGFLNGNKNFLRDLWSNYEKADIQTFYKQCLFPLFFEVFNKRPEKRNTQNKEFLNLPYLNGGLFRKSDIEKKYPEYDVENDIIKYILLNLLDKEFKSESTQMVKEGCLDPQILGYIFERAINHKYGSYYTPDLVTDFISRKTIEKILLDKTNDYLNKIGREKIDSLESFFNLERPIIMDIYEKFICKIKILDPAVGSGHFLLSAQVILLQLHRKILQIMDKKYDEYKLKKKIIQENLYGLDIISYASEITKLRLWLSLIEEIDDVDNIEKLPNIEYNIRTGNTLVGFMEKIMTNSLSNFLDIDISEVEILKELHPDEIESINVLKKKPNIANLIKIKEILLEIYKKEEEDRTMLLMQGLLVNIYKKIGLHLNKLYIDYIKELVGPSKVDKDLEVIKIFNWIFEFSEEINEGGFDIVIGNPPYGNEQIPQLRKYNQDKGHNDIYTLFLEKGLQLTRKGGYLCYITPTSWETGERYTSIREKLLHKHTLKYVINLPFNVFSEAYVDNAISLFKKEIPKKDDSFFIYTYGKKEKIATIRGVEQKSKSINYEFLFQDKFKIYNSIKIYNLLNKFVDYPKLGSITDSTIGILASKYNIGDKKHEGTLPYFIGNVYRYELKKENLRYIDFSHHTDEYMRYYLNPRILVRRIVNRSNRLMATFTKEQFVCKKDLYSFILTSEKFNIEYLLALLNSKFFSYMYLNTSTIATKDDFRQTTLTELRDLPIYPLKNQESIEKIVNLIIDLKKLKMDYWKDIDNILDYIIYDFYFCEGKLLFSVEKLLFSYTKEDIKDKTKKFLEDFSNNKKLQIDINKVKDNEFVKIIENEYKN